MRENIEFLKAFVKNPLKVGAIAPSSRDLAKQMLEGIKPDENSVLIELGPGTGSFTKLLSKTIPCEKSYLGVEIDKNLVKSLRTNFSNMRFMRGDACKISALHKRSKFGKVDYILSGLPFASMPSDVNERIFAEIEKFMDKGCMFRTFQYAHGYYLPPAIKLRAFMRDRYGISQKSPLVIKNVPPALTLTWQSN